jgi:hypothetical protein
MIAMTTSSSIKVKAERAERFTGVILFCAARGVGGAIF